MMEGPTSVSILLFPMKGNPLGSSFASSRGVNQRPGSTDTEKDRAKAEKDRIGVTDGWMYLLFNGGAPWDLHHFVRSHTKNSML